MTTVLHEKKLMMHAAETAYYGSITHRAYDVFAGTRTIDGVDYSWQVDNNRICTFYELVSEVKMKCADF